MSRIADRKIASISVTIPTMGQSGVGFSFRWLVDDEGKLLPLTEMVTILYFEAHGQIEKPVIDIVPITRI